MAERLYCCVDGGGSRTRVALVDGHGRRLALVVVAPTSLTLRGAEAWDVIAAALRGLCADAGVATDDFSAIAFGIGLAGANNATQRGRFIAAAPKTAALHVATDAYIAALGAHAGAPGAIVIVGTGSVGCRIYADGTVRQVGGWGFPLGDEGSGAWLGRAALARAVATLDSRAPAQADGLSYAVISRRGGSRDAILEWTRNARASDFAQLAPLVIEWAGKGDGAARSLAAAAGREIDALACALDPRRQTPLALVGGLAQPLEPFLPDALRGWARPPHGDALAGALLLARGDAPEERLLQKDLQPCRT